jgi:hypothetical protein
VVGHTNYREVLRVPVVGDGQQHRAHCDGRGDCAEPFRGRGKQVHTCVIAVQGDMLCE